MTDFHQRDDLSRPLGLEPAAARRPSLAALLATGAVLAAAAGIAYVSHLDDRLGGEPYAVATIDDKPVAPPAAPRAPAPPATTGQPEQLSASQIEAQSGVKIVRNGAAAPPGSLIIEVPQTIGLHLNPAPDERLIEKSRYGLLPRVGPDGARPADVYARPLLVPANLKGAPRVALLVGGLGLSEEGTTQAIQQLPGAVSLGFAPYGGAVERLVADARDSGHEAILQVPMESFDADSPGPHVLRTSASENQLLDDLHWLMARFSGYVGIANYLGAKFTADEAAVSPVLRDVASRGLIYVDDGTSPRSLARGLAGRLNLPAVSADVVIDAVQTPQAIDEALTRLEALARANGSAVGVASALPVSVEHIARWARSLEGRGLALTPISAIVTRGPGQAAAIAAPTAPR